MATGRTVPWDEIRDAQLAKAAYQLEHQPIIPDEDAGGWWVHSSTGDGQVYLVMPKWTRAERQAGVGRRNGQWWHVLTCTCQAAQNGYMLCWHKAAVYLYWQQCRNAKRPEGVGAYLMNDGPLPTPEPEATEGSTTPEAAPTSDQPSPTKAKAGTKRRDATPRASVARKTRPKSR